MENDVLLRDFLRRLDGMWKSKNQLEFECRIQFQKIDAIPELENKDGNGNFILSMKDRSLLFKRMKYLRLIEIYRNLIVCCEALGYSVHRTDNGKHSISKLNHSTTIEEHWDYHVFCKYNVMHWNWYFIMGNSVRFVNIT